MAFRTVTIKNRCKLEYSLNYLVCRAEEETRIAIDEISTLIIQNTGVAITAALLSELINKKVKVIFCDTKSNPQSELVPYQGTFDSYGKILTQISWSQATKNKIWKVIISEKIRYQKLNLEYVNEFESSIKLKEYLEDVIEGDVTNREGHAAKVYFNSLFGKNFSRSIDCAINKYLNYGYSILLSCINREVKTFGYLTELGIHHIGNENPFNLSCDLIEPLRPYVDKMVIRNDVNDENFKKIFIEMLNNRVNFNGNNMYLENAIHLYVQSVFLALKENNPSKVMFVDYEFI